MLEAFAAATLCKEQVEERIRAVFVVNKKKKSTRTKYMSSPNARTSACMSAVESEDLMIEVVIDRLIEFARRAWKYAVTRDVPATARPVSRLGECCFGLCGRTGHRPETDESNISYARRQVEGGAQEGRSGRKGGTSQLDGCERSPSVCESAPADSRPKCGVRGTRPETAAEIAACASRQNMAKKKTAARILRDDLSLKLRADEESAEAGGHLMEMCAKLSLT